MNTKQKFLSSVMKTMLTSPAGTRRYVAVGIKSNGSSLSPDALQDMLREQGMQVSKDKLTLNVSSPSGAQVSLVLYAADKDSYANKHLNGKKYVKNIVLTDSVRTSTIQKLRSAAAASPYTEYLSYGR